MTGPCAICEHARLHGWFGPEAKGGAHCKHCHRTWKGRTQAHCLARVGDRYCCGHFASYGVANLHWGSGKSTGAPSYGAKHLDPTTVPRLRQDADGIWHTAAEMPAYWRGAA